MADKPWKALERRMAQQLNGTRLGATGKETPDVVTDWLSVECKYRTRLPDWLSTALGKIRQHAGKERLGIVVLHEKHQRDSIVLLSLKDFRDWFGPIELAEEM